MKCLKLTIVACVVAATAAVGSVSALAADAAENFYRGKTVQVLVGFGPGGVADLTARTVAQKIGRAHV